MKYGQYIFFDTDIHIRSIGEVNREIFEKELLALIESEERIKIFSYGTLGLRPGTKIMLWMNYDDPKVAQDFLNTLLKSHLGKYLKITHSLFGMRRTSTYNKRGSEKEILLENPRKKYLIVYPFTKTTEWNLLPFEERKQMMIEHMNTAHKSEGIEQLLLYSYGIDDDEFVLAYETDSLENFQELVINLRQTKGRAYTRNDTPIFTCIHRDLPEVLKFI